MLRKTQAVSSIIRQLFPTVAKSSLVLQNPNTTCNISKHKLNKNKLTSHVRM